MDTIFVESKKHYKLTLNTINALIVAAICFFSSSGLLAKERMLIANTVTPIINTTIIEKKINKAVSNEKESQKFEESIKQRYRSGIIKDVEVGVKHIKVTKFYNGRPVKINVVEVNRNLNSELKITPVLASDKLNKKLGISKIAKKNNSIVAINGTFFKPQTGVPLGTLMIDKEIQTGPIYNRVALGIFDNYFDTARVQLNAFLTTKNKKIQIDNINQPRMLSTYVLMYTSKWGEKSATTPKYGKQIAISKNKIIEISQSPLQIPEDGCVISGPASKLNGLKVGDNIKLDITTIPEWKNVNHIISGGPYLIKRGEIYIDVKEEKLHAIRGRNPRTAIGYTSDNNLILVTVDGREQTSVGMSLKELAMFMKSIGCYEAINLDGGGSSVLYINGQIMNKPAQKGGIALSNALTISL